MQEPFSELMRGGRLDGVERRRIDLLDISGEQGNSIKVELSQRTKRNLTLVTGSRTVSATGTITKKTVREEVDEEDDKVMFEMEKGASALTNTCGEAKVSQQVDEKAANNHHGKANNGDRSGDIGDQNGVNELGSHSKDSKESGRGSTSGNIEWISSAGEAQEAITRVFQEQVPGISYCHECGW
jgi:hypothetical protein